MKMLFAATPAPGHINPLLTIATMAKARGHEVILTTASAFRSNVEAAGVRFVALAPAADFDLREIPKLFPERTSLTPGPDMMRFDYERIFIDTMLPQAQTLTGIMAAERPDVIIADNYFCGTTPLFLGTAARPPILNIGVTFLPLDRPDHAPTCLGLPPAQDAEDRREYQALAEVLDAAFARPVQAYANQALAAAGLPSLAMSFNESRVRLADAYVQPTIPAFEYDFGTLPEHLHFVGALPTPRHAVDRPTWWTDVIGKRPIVLVTQGTVANYDFGQLLEPTLIALADRKDLLVLATTGGRPTDSLAIPIPDNARVATFLPFDEVLPQTAVLVTNGGYGTVSLALRAGVPIVSAGKTEDKAEVSARVQWSGVGLDLGSNTPSPQDIRNGVDTILAVPTFACRAGALARDFQAMTAETKIFSLIDSLVQQSADRELNLLDL
jgi:UDP:flavonoid glycosyltransferase YjiC (YdhE family)